jgi:hypothetical protein
MGIWLEPPDYGRGFRFGRERAASCMDCLRTARGQTLFWITASRYFFIECVAASVAAITCGKIGPAPQARPPQQPQKP